MSISKKLLCILPIVFLVAVSTKADTADVWVNGSVAFFNNGFGIGPYGGTITYSTGGTHSASFFCVDFKDRIHGNSGWTATITSLTGGSYSSTLLKNQTTYLEMAWLVSQMLNLSPSNPQYQTIEAQLQWAIWALSGPLGLASDPYLSSTLSLESQAANQVKNGWTSSGWQILTPTGSYGQEFLIHTVSEPASLLLLGIGFLSISFLRNLKTRKRAAQS